MSSIRVISYPMNAAEVGSENPLPDLKTVQYVHAAINVGPSVTQEESRYIGYGMLPSILPYKIQDGYTRERKMHAFQAFVLENAHLRATFLPEVGGRLWSLYHKDEARELLYVNPVFQPCHLALRNAWFSGGVEWNMGIKGHTPYTCEPLHTQIVRVNGQEILRMYAYERIRRSVFCIEAWLPEESQVLLVKVRLTNTAEETVPMYWWSNIAVDETPHTRVIAPADEAMECFYSGGAYSLDKVDVPYTVHGDCSYPTNLHRVTDYFFLVPEENLNWISAIEKDGKGLFETSTKRLHGRKVFQWGMAPGGRRWQEFLSEPGQAYIEIQAGLANTQLEHLPMGAGESWTFLEAYGLAACDPQEVHGESWRAALRAVEQAIRDSLCGIDLEGILSGPFEEISRAPGETVLLGCGWGALENLRRAKTGLAPLDAVLPFPKASLSEQQAPWISLLETGILPIQNPEQPPISFMIQRNWEDDLRYSLQRPGGDHWFSRLMFGLMLYGQGDSEGAQREWEVSYSYTANGWAARNLAQLYRVAGDFNNATRLIRDAKRLLPECGHIAQEFGTLLIAAGEPEAFLEALETMPQALSKLPRIQFLHAQALCRAGRLTEAEAILLDHFILPDIREGEISISDLWQEIQLAKLRRAVANDDEVALRTYIDATFPLPYELDFRMH